MKPNSYLKQFEYYLPQELIAQKPTLPRDRAKLMVYHRQTGKMSEDLFFNLNRYLPQNSVLIFNQTKVIPARLLTRKSTGGQVEVFYLETIGKQIKALVSPGQRPQTKLYLTKPSGISKDYFLVTGQEGKVFYLKPSFSLQKLSRILQRYGQTPIPPYLQPSPLTEEQLKKHYQTVFAKTPGSVAAPTASLHFTQRLLKKLHRRGHKIGFLNLNINLGTFMTLEPEQLKTNKLHQERFFIPQETRRLIRQAKENSWPIIACGTTVVRALESLNSPTPETDKTDWKTTELFIRPGYRFKVIDGLITNFHLPRSSLLMLVCAFAGREAVLHLYQEAVKKHYRFYSFGDAMLIL